jgi:plastocyanin
MKKLIAAPAVGAVLLLLMSGPAPAQTGPSVAAEIVDFDFGPRELTVNANTQITWTNKGARPHTVTDRGGTFDTNPIAPGAKGTVTFSVPGRYYFFCRINPSKMNGTLIVRSSAQATVNRIQATDPAREGNQLSFDPAAVSVPTGTMITFANVGGKPHTLTADDGSFDTGVVTPGAENGKFAGSNATISLNKPGTFRFHCEVHPQAMKGTLTVTGAEKQGAGESSAAARTATVDIEDFAFKPAEASIAPGGKVSWRNGGEARHTATFDDVALDTADIAPGAEGSLTAPGDPGSYSYRCNIHPARMRGVLVVVGQNVADPSKADEAAPGGAAGSSRAGPGVTALALGSGLLGAFLGGLGIASFRRRAPTPPPPPPPSEPDSAAA